MKQLRKLAHKFICYGREYTSPQPNCFYEPMCVLLPNPLSFWTICTIFKAQLSLIRLVVTSCITNKPTSQ